MALTPQSEKFLLERLNHQLARPEMYGTILPGMEIGLLASTIILCAAMGHKSPVERAVEQWYKERARIPSAPDYLPLLCEVPNNFFLYGKCKATQKQIEKALMNVRLHASAAFVDCKSYTIDNSYNGVLGREAIAVIEQCIVKVITGKYNYFLPQNMPWVYEDFIVVLLSSFFDMNPEIPTRRDTYIKFLKCKYKGVQFPSTTYVKFPPPPPPELRKQCTDQMCNGFFNIIRDICPELPLNTVEPHKVFYD
jgi:hypothetical protein